MRKLAILLLTLAFYLTSFSQISSNMTLLGNWDVDTLPTAGNVQYNDIWGYVDCAGNEYAIMGSASRVHFINVTDPSNPTEVASFAGGQTTVWRDMKTYKDRAYAVSDNTNEGLMIFDLSDLPNSVTMTYQSNDFWGRSHNIFIDEANGRLYSVGTDTRSGGVIILDLTNDPDNPTLLSSINLPANPNSGTGYVHDIYVRDNIAYASHGFLGYFIWDLNDPNVPVLLASRDTGAYNHSSWVSEDGSFAIYAEEVPTGRPIGVMNLENLTNEFIEIDTTFQFPLIANEQNTPHNPFIRGNLLICSYYEDGLQVYDVSDRMNPIPVAHYDTYPDNVTYNGYNGNWGTYPFLPSGRILASDIESGLFVLELDASIPIANIDALTVPDLSDQFIDTVELCLGENYNLELPSGFDTYEWFRDGTMLAANEMSLLAEQSGTYYGQVYNQHCVATTNSIEVIFKDVPDFSSLPTDDVSACEGDLIPYEVPSGYDAYTWTRDGDTVSNTNTLEVSQNGTYQLVSTLNNCTLESTPVAIIFNPIPSVEIIPQGPTTFCVGTFLNLNTMTNAEDSLWTWTQNGIPFNTEADVPVTESGLYEVQITDINGCTNVASVEITVNDPILPTATLDGNTLTATEANYYQWFKDGSIIQGANNQNYNLSEVGAYYVGTVDSIGCFGVSNIINVDVVAARELKNVEEFSIFPNPVNELLQAKIVLSQSDDFTTQIIDLNGKILFENFAEAQSSDQIQIDVSHFPKGIYLLKIQNHEGQMVRKFVK
ncbi:MAG: choice-of-anchor B family protein [Bacteroidota bacterium]